MHPLESLRAPTLAAALLGLLSPAEATWPGDNGVIVYGDGQAIYRVASDGTGTPARLSTGDDPKVSPDGRLVAFTRTTPYWAQLLTMNIDGSNTVLLGVGSKPAWSPDGKKLAYYVDAGTSGNSAVYVYDTASAAKTLLGKVSPFGGGVARLDWSPAGDWLVYSLKGTAQGYIMNAATGASLALDPNMVYASWWPDATALVGGRAGSTCAFRMSTNGAQVQSLRCPGQWPSVSPDGSRLLSIAAGAPGTAGTLTSQPLAGGAATSLAAAAVTADWSRQPRVPMVLEAIDDQPWTAPTPLGFDPGTYIARSALVSMPDNGMLGQALRRAVGIGADGRLYERAQQASNGAWGNWVLVPGYAGQPLGQGIVVKRVAIDGALDGSLQAVIVDSQSIVYHAMRYANGAWSGFRPLAGAGGAPNFAARDVAIAIVNSSATDPGQAHVAATGLADGPVGHTIRLNNGSWSSWLLLPGEQNLGAVALSFADNQDLYLVATSPTRGIVRQLRRPSGAWDGWVTMSTDANFPIADLSLAVKRGLGPIQQPSLAWVAFIAADGGAFVNRVPDPYLASSWTTAPLPQQLMNQGRSVSVSPIGASGVQLVVTQPQPQ